MRIRTRRIKIGQCKSGIINSNIVGKFLIASINDGLCIKPIYCNYK